MLRRAMLAPTRAEMINRTWLQCRGSKSAIQSPENLPEEPSRLWLEGCRSASRSSLITPSGELENSSITSPWYPASSMRKRFRIWMVLKLKTSSSLLPVHVIDVSVRPSSNKSVVPSPSTPNAGHTEVNRVRSYHDFRHQRQHHHTGIEIHHRSAGIEVGAADELFLVAPESGGVDGFADGLPQVVLRRGEQVEKRRRVVLRADEL